MRLKSFNSENCSGLNKRSSHPTISIDTKVGTLRLNREVCELLSLKAGDQVEFHQDEDEASEWYIEKVKTDGFVVRDVKGATGVVVLNNTPLTKLIAESVEFTDRAGRCLVAGQPTKHEGRKLFGILTATLRNKK